MLKQKIDDRILFILKTKGPQTAQLLADTLGMTSMGARQHLQQLEGKSLITSHHKKAGVGRPKQYWQLAKIAEDRFPNTHAHLTLELLDAVRQAFGNKGVDKIISQREQKMLAIYQQKLSKYKSLEKKIAELVMLRDNEGYMAEYQKCDDGSFLLIENHCPICAAAEKCQALCKSELQLFRQALADKNINITRESHIVTGQRRCVYRIKKEI